MSKKIAMTLSRAINASPPNQPPAHPSQHADIQFQSTPKSAMLYCTPCGAHDKAAVCAQRIGTGPSYHARKHAFLVRVRKQDHALSSDNMRRKPTQQLGIRAVQPSQQPCLALLASSLSIGRDFLSNPKPILPKSPKHRRIATRLFSSQVKWTTPSSPDPHSLNVLRPSASPTFAASCGGSTDATIFAK